MTLFVGLDVSQRMTAICVVDDAGRRVWRGQCASDPEQIEQMVRRHAGDDARIGLETGPMTPWLVHELRAGRFNKLLRSFVWLGFVCPGNARLPLWVTVKPCA
jgi:ribosomal protein L39E